MAYDNIMDQYQERLKKWILDERAYATVADIIHNAIEQGMDFFLEQTSSGKHILKTMRR
jgi:predicted ABC-type ATPase